MYKKYIYPPHERRTTLRHGSLVLTERTEEVHRMLQGKHLGTYFNKFIQEKRTIPLRELSRFSPIMCSYQIFPRYINIT